jgi:hypothetical protein
MRLDIVADALDRAWEQLRCTCGVADALDSAMDIICDCAVSQVGEARDILRVRAEQNLRQSANQGYPVTWGQ